MAKTKRDKPREALFVEGVNLYRDEYPKLKKSPIVPELIGVFEVAGDVYGARTPTQLLSYVGLEGYSAIAYDSEFNVAPTRSTEGVSGTGCVVAAKTPFGKVRPVIFVRKDVTPSDGVTSEEFEAGSRLLILLHELGHAEDMVKSINYDHQSKKLNVISAEVYAHRFVCTQAKRRGYLRALSYYVANIEEQVESKDDVCRLSAIRAMKELDIAGFKAACGK